MKKQKDRLLNLKGKNRTTNMTLINEKSITVKNFIDVRFFYENVRNRFNLNLLTSEEGFDRKIQDPNVHRPGLALAGYLDIFSYHRIQIFGNTEMKYLKSLTTEVRRASLEKFFSFDIPCIVITNENKIFDEMAELATKFKVPVFVSPFSTTKLVYFISDFLDDQFAPKVSIHGSFVDVYGVGVLFIGKSGIGKSEVALDLIERGHRLVADDLVILTKKGEGILMGSGTDVVKHFMEIRGLGLINIEKMFGIRAIRYQKRAEVIVELENWDPGGDYDRTGLDENTMSILGVNIPHIKLPIIPGKNITVISEVISLNYLLKHYGYDAARVLQHKLTDRLREKKGEIGRGVDYFEHDFE